MTTQTTTWRDATTERELYLLCKAGGIPVADLTAAGEHLAQLKIAEFQKRNPKPKGRVRVCDSCGGWSHHGVNCRGCKRVYGPLPAGKNHLTLALKCAIDLGVNHPEGGFIGETAAKRDAIQYITQPAGAADRPRRQ